MKKTNISPEIKNEIFTMYKNIKYLREQYGLTTKELAEIINISEKKLILSEACVETECFYDVHIKNLCAYFRIKSSDLFDEDFIEKPNK